LVAVVSVTFTLGNEAHVDLDALSKEVILDISNYFLLSDILI
jgi:hypothetical protein